MSADPIYRGEHAARILSDPLVSEALATIKDGVRDLFFELGSEQAEKREMLHLMDRARQQFVGVFTLLVNGAEVHKHELLAESQVQARVEAIQRMTYDR